MSCLHFVRWRTSGGATIFRKTLHLPNVQKEDAREYICEVTDIVGRVKQQRVVVIEVQCEKIIKFKKFMTAASNYIACAEEQLKSSIFKNAT